MESMKMNAEGKKTDTQEKKWTFIMDRKGYVLKLSPACIHQHTEQWRKMQEIPGDAVLAPLLSPAFVD